MKRISVIGGGPGGLYFAYLWKSRHPQDSVTVFEQNARDATFGFGVVFSDRAMDFLQAGDPETADQITARMEAWSNPRLFTGVRKLRSMASAFQRSGDLIFCFSFSSGRATPGSS